MGRFLGCFHSALTSSGCLSRNQLIQTPYSSLLFSPDTWSLCQSSFPTKCLEDEVEFVTHISFKTPFPRDCLNLVLARFGEITLTYEHSLFCPDREDLQTPRASFLSLSFLFITQRQHFIYSFLLLVTIVKVSVVLCLLQNNHSLIWSIYFLRYKASSSVKIFLIPCSMAIPPSCFCTSRGYNPHQAVLSSLLTCGLPFWTLVPYVSCLPSTQNNVGAQGLLNKRMGKEHECRSSLLKQTDGTCQIAQSSWV